MWHTSRDIHCKYFEGICSYIEDIIIDSKDVHLTNSINFQCKMLLIEIGGEEFIESNFTTQKLEIKLLKHFGDKILRRGNIIFSSSITVEDAFRRETNMKWNINIKAREVAYALRSEILKAQKTTSPENLTIKDILKGEVQVPDIVNKFFNNLICGPNQQIKLEELNQLVKT